MPEGQLVGPLGLARCVLDVQAAGDDLAGVLVEDGDLDRTRLGRRGNPDHEKTADDRKGGVSHRNPPGEADPESTLAPEDWQPGAAGFLVSCYRCPHGEER